jgi:hypothetical protein
MDANQNRTGQKTEKLTDYTSNGGRFSFGTFFVRTKKVPRCSAAKKHIKDRKETLFPRMR